MSRLRYAGVIGTVGSGNMTNSATSHTFTAPLTYDAGVTVPTLAGSDYFLLSILDSSGALSEIVKVTAYTSGTGVATIARAQEGTSGVSHTSGDKVTQAVYASDLGAKTIVFKFAGTLVTGVGATRFYNDSGVSWTLRAVRATVETSPSGGAVTVDLNINGTTAFTTQGNRPSIASAGTTNKATAIDVTTVADGDYLTADIDVATAPAANLTVEVTYA